jgi:mycofactocin system glycosyltransferase
VLYLSPRAIALFEGRDLVVESSASRSLANLLLDAGMAEPVLDALPEGPTAITYVVPVRDRARQLRRLLESIPRDAPRIVVDDASRDPAAVASVVRDVGAQLVALTENVGSAGARNAGLAEVRTPFVAFVDSDVVLDPHAVPLLARHFADPRVAVVAPRVAGLESARQSWVTRYEAARSSLDLGRESASVRPFSPVTWVSSTFLLARVESIGAGFSAHMRVGEDVDFVWRMAAAGHRVRYEPAAVVYHEHRAGLVEWMSRKAFYGTGAKPLADAHPEEIAPVVLPPWAVAMLLALLAQRRWSLPVASGIVVVTGARIARRLKRSDRPVAVAARLTGMGVTAALYQGASLLLRHWWPATAVAGVFSSRVRRAALVAGVVDALVDYSRTPTDLGPVRFGVLRRLDDLAYGAGVWAATFRSFSFRALAPLIRSRDSGR